MVSSLGICTGFETRAGYGYGSSRVRVRVALSVPVTRGRPAATGSMREHEGVDFRSCHHIERGTRPFDYLIIMYYLSICTIYSMRNLEGRRSPGEGQGNDPTYICSQCCDIFGLVNDDALTDHGTDTSTRQLRVHHHRIASSPPHQPGCQGGQ
jgi:hypothetical protein